MRLATYVPGELIPLPLSGSIPELPHVAKVENRATRKISRKLWITITAYPWIKALHVVAVISWMAGMLYLPRLFVYHCDAEIGSKQSETSLDFSGAVSLFNATMDVPGRFWMK